MTKRDQSHFATPEPESGQVPVEGGERKKDLMEHLKALTAAELKDYVNRRLSSHGPSGPSSN